MSRTETTSLLPGAVLNLTNELINEHQPHQQPQSTEVQDDLTPPGHSILTEKELEQIDNPDGWPTLRGTPHYRPLNRHVDLSTRPNGSNTIEWVIVNIMLNGVLAQGYIRTVWRAAGSPFGSYFRYQIGGLY